MEGVTHVVTSAHFAVKWGDEGGPTVAEAELALAQVETAYDLQVLQLGLEEPDGMSIARMNVYVVGTGVTANGEPLWMAYGAAGMATVDPDGWPMFLVHPDSWVMDAEGAADGEWAPGDWLGVLFAHEFHHTVQSAEHVFLDETWFVEGTAQWAAELQVQGHPMVWWSAASLTDRPEVALEWSGALGVYDPDDPYAALHPYGTFALPAVLTHEVGRDLVVDWLSDEGGADRATDRLADLLAARDLRLDTVVAATWAELLAGALGPVPPPVPDAHLPTFALGRGEDERPPEALRPGRLGANVVALDLGDRPAQVTLDAEPTGDEGSPATFAVATVTCRGDDCVPEVRGVGVTAGAWTLEADDADRVELIVVPWSPSYLPSERFDYSLSVADVPRPEPRGCESAGGAGPALVPWVLLPALRRRRVEVS